MIPQQPWGQRSSRGQWPFSHLNRYGIKSSITMIAQVCDRKSRRDSWFENPPVFFACFFNPTSRMVWKAAYLQGQVLKGYLIRHQIKKKNRQTRLNYIHILLHNTKEHWDIKDPCLHKSTMCHTAVLLMPTVATIDIHRRSQNLRHLDSGMGLKFEVFEFVP